MSFKRKMKRQIARNEMKEYGYKRLNKKRMNPRTQEKASMFSMNWRYILGKKGID